MDKKLVAKELLKVARLLVAGKEYAIWGIPPGQTEETLLLAKPQGKFITDRGHAERLKKLLEEKYGATKVRIQEIDMDGELDWNKEIGMK